MRPYDNPDAHNVIVLGTTVSPGVVTLSGHDRVKNWDVKAAKGQTGASSALQGDPIGEFKASFFLVDDETDPDVESEFDRWEEFQALLETLSGSKPSALPVYNPDLARNHFTEVSVKMIGGARHDGRGGVTYDVDFIEYNPPKPRKSKRTKATSAQSAKPKDKDIYDPNKAAKDQLAGLLDEAKQP